jgi:hypothetical protein
VRGARGLSKRDFMGIGQPHPQKNRRVGCDASITSTCIARNAWNSSRHAVNAPYIYSFTFGVHIIASELLLPCLPETTTAVRP